MILDILGQVFVVTGGVVFLAAAVGLIRLDDPYTRASSVATAAGLGVTLVVAGSVLLDPSVPAAIKAVIAIVLQLVTAAIGGIALARGAVLSGHSFNRRTDVGELTENEHPER